MNTKKRIFSMEVWSFFCTHFHLTSPTDFEERQRWLKDPISDANTKLIIRLLFQASMYHIWKERSARLHSGVSRQAQLIISDIKQQIQLRLDPIYRRQRVDPGALNLWRRTTIETCVSHCSAETIQFRNGEWMSTWVFFVSLRSTDTATIGYPSRFCNRKHCDFSVFNHINSGFVQLAISCIKRFVSHFWKSRFSGRCSSVVEARLLRFWEARNVKPGGELMWLDLLRVYVNPEQRYKIVGVYISITWVRTMDMTLFRTFFK